MADANKPKTINNVNHDLTPLQNAMLEFRRFFSAGAGEEAALSVLKLVEHMLGELANDETPAWARPIEDFIEEKVKDLVNAKVQSWLESAANDAKAGATVTAEPTPTAVKTAPEPDYSENVPESFRATFDALPADAKRAYWAAHKPSSSSQAAA